MSGSAEYGAGAAASPQYVARKPELKRLCRRLLAVGRFGLDTEFVGERSYLPRLELIQVATAEECALVDCRAVSDLDPFFEILANPAVEKVVHAGRQDLELFYRLSGTVPAPVFDVQLAAAMVGYGAQPGYGPLVERLLGVTLEKSETLTDWSQRPLTPEQIAYAADDVRYLLPLYERLRERLIELGRWEWLQEELRRLEAGIRAESVTPEQAYLRVKGRGSLRAKGLVVLRALAAWREEVARERDRPRTSILRDEALVEVARKAPTTVEALRGLRAVRSRELTRSAEEVVRRVREALSLPREQWPEPQRTPARSHVPAGVTEVLQAVLRARAEQNRIAPGLLATQSDLQELVQAHARGAAQTVPLMQGWRRELVGEELLALLHGRACVRIDPKRHEIRVERTPAGPVPGNPARGAGE